MGPQGGGGPTGGAHAADTRELSSVTAPASQPHQPASQPASHAGKPATQASQKLKLAVSFRKLCPLWYRGRDIRRHTGPAMASNRHHSVRHNCCVLRVDGLQVSV